MPALPRQSRFERWLALTLTIGLTGCGANCLRDSDCDDGHVCLRDSCVRPNLAEDASAGGAAGQAGGQGMINPSYPGLGGTGGAAGVGGASMTEQGGAAGTNSSQGGSAGTDASFGGSATQPRENLDASADADADVDAG